MGQHTRRAPSRMPRLHRPKTARDEVAVRTLAREDHARAATRASDGARGLSAAAVRGMHLHVADGLQRVRELWPGSGRRVCMRQSVRTRGDARVVRDHRHGHGGHRRQLLLRTSRDAGAGRRRRRDLAREQGAAECVGARAAPPVGRRRMRTKGAPSSGALVHVGTDGVHHHAPARRADRRKQGAHDFGLAHVHRRGHEGVRAGANARARGGRHRHHGKAGLQRRRQARGTPSTDSCRSGTHQLRRRARVAAPAGETAEQLRWWAPLPLRRDALEGNNEHTAAAARH